MKKGMDSELINIQNIRNLESIRYAEHLLSKGLIPILQITYDGGKHMILSSTDKYFYSFVKKVIDVYNLEKNSIVDDSLTDPFRIRNKIDIDSKTEKVLESGILTDINSLYSFYKDKHAYNKSLIYQIDEVKSLLPMLIYHLEDFLTSFIVKSTFDTNISGYKDNYTLKHGRFLVDAKSILGIFTLDLDNKIELYSDKISLDVAELQIELEEANILTRE